MNLPNVTDIEIEAIRTMSRAERDALKERINATDPTSIFQSAGNSKNDNKRIIFCPKCGNGSGEDGTPIEVKFKGGRWLYNCFRCDEFSGDLLKIIADEENLNMRTRDDYFKALAIGASLIGYVTGTPLKQKSAQHVERKNDDDAKRAAQLPLIKADIADAQAHLEELPESQRRGISVETYRHFQSGYLEKWVHPQTRIDGKKGFPGRRVIFPAGEQHYQAVALPADRDSMEKKYWKLSAGSLKLFNSEALRGDEQTVIVVEGQYDAISIWQAFGGEIAVVAVLGVRNWQKTLLPLLDDCAAGKKFLILFDVDKSKAGEDGANNLRGELEKRNIHATCKFFEDFMSDADKEKISGTIDANAILQTLGNEALKTVTEKIISDAQIDFAAQEEKITADRAFNEKISAWEEDKSQTINPEDFLWGSIEDLDNGRRLAKFCGDRVKWLVDEERWLAFGNGVWTRGSENFSCFAPEIANFADMMMSYGAQLSQIENEAKKALDALTTNEDGSIKINASKAKDPVIAAANKKWERASTRTKNAFAIAYAFHKQKKISPAVTLMKTVESIRIKAEDLDKHNHLLNCQNGVIDLQTGKLYPADPKLLLTRQVAAVYRPGYHNTTVEKFLQDILPDEPTRAALIRFLGYAATGEVLEEKALFIAGKGGNGKGTLTRTLLTLYGDYATALRVTAILYAGRPQDAGAPTAELNPLEGKRLAIVEELPQGGKLDVAKFKNLTGGDKIPIRELHKEQRDIVPHFSPIFSGNYLPELSDPRDPALLRRLLNIRFGESFIGDKRDPRLKQKLVAPEALTGLLTLIVDAAQVWYRDGLLESSNMRQATKAWTEENDFLGDFIEEYCTRGATLSIPRKNFIAKLKACYTADCLRVFGNRDKSICDAVNRIDWIEYRKGGENHSYKFYGIGWRDAHAQQSAADFAATPVAPDDTPF